MSTHGTIHGLLGGFVFLLMPICILLFLGGFRTVPRWKAVWWWTLVLGILDSIAVIFFTLSSKLDTLQEISSGWIGLIQRMALIPFMIWLFIFAVHNLRLNKE